MTIIFEKLIRNIETFTF